MSNKNNLQLVFKPCFLCRGCGANIFVEVRDYSKPILCKKCLAEQKKKNLEAKK